MASVMEAVPIELLVDVKNYLGQTWTDEDSDRRITEYIASGIVYLDGKLGDHGDYLVPGQPRTLLFEYVRYARDGAMDIFEANYLHLLLSMQSERQLKDYAQAETDQAGE